MSIDAHRTAEIQVENVADFAKFIVAQSASHGSVNSVVQISDATAPILQVDDAVAGGAIIQMSEASVAPLVQVGDQTHGLVIEGLPAGIQIVDGAFPSFVQASDGNFIQLAPSGAGTEGLTQVVQFANGQFALIEQQENIDPQTIQHLVFEEVQPGLGAGEDPGEQEGEETSVQQVVIKQEYQEVQPPVGKGPFKCEICDKSLPKWNQLQRHLKSHAEDKPFRCISCPESFNMADNLKLHLATHVEPGDRPRCPECGKNFSRVASLKAHIMLHEKEESVMCTECGDEFALQSQLDRHVTQHQEGHDSHRVYACKQCTQEFPRQALLKEHTKQHYKIKTSLSHRPYKKVLDRTGFTHKCSHCLKSFQKPSQLERHVRVHTGERPFKCTICTKAFNQKGALSMHMMGKHLDKKPHKCEFCNSGFAQKGNLRAHIQRVHTLSADVPADQLFSCEDCSCVFRKLGSLNAHISRFHTDIGDLQDVPLYTSTEEILASGDGKESTEALQQLIEMSVVEGQQQQQQQQQQQGEDILQQALQNSGVPGAGNNNNNKEGECSIQTMTVRDAATGLVKKHIIRRVNGVRWHQCTFCTKEFKKPSDLVRHIRIHSHEKPYKCTQCFRAFAVKSTLTAHLRTHSGTKQHPCDVCEKLFSTHGSLKVHVRLHTGARPFECPRCDKKFRTAAHRKSHILAHFKEGDNSRARAVQLRRLKRRNTKDNTSVPDIPLQEPILITDTGLIQQPPRNNLLTQFLGDSHSVDRPYKCSYCQRGFKKSSHLKQHVRSHTGEKPYKCIQCGRTFVSNGVLKAHIRIHSGMKQYKCLLCDNMFTTNGSLKRHMSTHSEVRPFMCPYCQKTFKTSVNCKKHMKTHRPELAVQSNMAHADLNQIQQEPSNEQIQIQGYQEETHTINPDATFSQQEVNQNDLGLVQQELSTAPMLVTQDISQQTMMGQANLQDALSLGSSNLDQTLQQTLNQQMFGQQQTFSQSLLGSGQQNFQQINVVSQTAQYIQPQQQVSQIDIAALENSFAPQQVEGLQVVEGVEIVPAAAQSAPPTTHIPSSSMASTSMQNILHTEDVGDTINVVDDVDDDDDDDDDVDDDLDEELPAPDAQAPGDDADLQKAVVYVSVDSLGRNYPCHLCERSFKKSSHLKQHIRSHTGEKPYKCTTCERTFVSMGVLRSHLRTHSGTKEYKCSICRARFTTNGSLTRHMNIHVSIKPYKCPFCLEAFRTASICKRHMKLHSEGAEVETVETPMGTIPKSQLRYVELDTEAVKEQYKTPADTTISEQMLLESAAEKERISEVKELQVAALDKNLHQCPQCVKSFKKPSDLVRHTRIHTGEKPFACQVCGRKFTVKSTLDSHHKTHGGIDKSIKCHVCSSMFSTKGSLKVHMRLHTGAKPFRCPHCTQRFRTSGHRKSHIISHYKPETSGRKRRTHAAGTNVQIQTMVQQPDTNQPSQPQVQTLDFLSTINAVEVQNPQIITQTPGQQIVNIDQSMFQGQNLMPLSVTVDGFGNQPESTLAAQVLQGLQGVQLQLSDGNLAQGIQITGLDPSVFNQTLQIDANLLQQLQSGNVNITLNPQQQIQATDTNLIQNIQIQPADSNLIQNVQIQQADQNLIQNVQIQPVTLPDAMNPGMVVQQSATINMDGQLTQDIAPNTFVVNTGDFNTQQQVQIGQPSVLIPPQNVALITQTGDATTTDSISKTETNIPQSSSGLTTSDLAGDLAVTEEGIESINTDLAHADTTVTDTAADIGVNADMGVDVNADIHGLNDEMATELDNVANPEMAAIDPNMTNQMDSITGGMSEDDSAEMNEQEDVQVDDLSPMDDEDGELSDDGMPQESVDDGLPDMLNEHLLMQAQSTSTSFEPVAEKFRAGPQRNYTCQVCMKAFKRNSHLKDHLLTHERLQDKVEKPVAPHVCPHCHKAFSKPSQMERHIRIHTGERPYVCGLCQKTFNQTNALQIHMRKHSKEKPYRCDYCVMGFTQKGNLKTHIKRAHHHEMVLSMRLPPSLGQCDTDGGDAHSVMVAGPVTDSANVLVTTEVTEVSEQQNEELSLEVADLFSQ